MSQVDSGTSSVQRAADAARSVGFSPGRFLIITIGGIFLAEVIAMLLLLNFRYLPYYLQTLIDSTIMVVLISPIVYTFSLRPLLLHIEKRRLAERALRQKEAMQERFFDSIDTLIAYMDRDFNFIKVNDAYAKVEGHPPEYFIGKNHFVLYPHAENLEIFRRVVETGEPVSVHEKPFDYPDKPGRGITYWNWSLQPVKGQEGKVAGVVLSLVDVTLRKRAQEQVREMALFPELNPDAVLQVDATGRIRKSNSAADQMGLSVGGQLSELIPDLRGLNLRTCIASGTTQPVYETQLGERILQWIIRGSPDLKLAFLYSTDITERKRAEQANRQLSRIVEQTEDTVVVTDRQGVIEYVNPAFERQTGYTKEEALGKTPRVIKSGIHDDEFYQNLWNTILKGDVFQSEIANCRKNGELFYEAKTITPLRDAQGNITHFVATGKDITRHKHHEAELRKAYDELEARVQKRTEELVVANTELSAEINERKKAQTALEQSQKELSASEERARHIIQYAPAAIYEIDFFGNRFVSVNDIACQWTGYTREELLSMNPLSLTDEESRTRFQERIKTKLSGESVDDSVEYKIITKVGHEIIVAANVGAMTYRDGQPERALVVAHNITERKRAEDALRAANEELTRFNRAMVGRELRMVELKEEVNQLCGSAGQPPRYALEHAKE